MDSVFITAGFAALAIVYGVYRRYSHISLADVPGPESASFIMGNLKELYQGQAADADFKWQAQYGNIVRFKGSFGEDQLMISDPAALQYIFAKSAYRFPKPPDRRVLSQLINGKGLSGRRVGDDHKRHRRIMLPGFGGPESKAFLLFKNCAESMSNKWTETINNSKEGSVVFNIPVWLSRATLDAIGEAAFDVRFSSIDDNESALRAHTGYECQTDVFGSPSDGEVLFQGISKYIPRRILEYFVGRAKTHVSCACVRGNLATSVAKQDDIGGQGSRDVFSLLVKANMDADAKAKLTEEELFAQMRTILLAGHETTSNTIWETEAAVHARGDVNFTIADFDAMPYTTAVMKEVLRFCPVISCNTDAPAKMTSFRCHSQSPRSGHVIRELPVPKGTRIVASIAAYNRNKELWGEDAHVFNPDRWLNGTAKEKKVTSIGVYSNLMTFGGGERSCIGWRFAVIEIQAFLTEIVGKFEFAPTDKTELIGGKLACEVENGVQLPLRVSLAPRTGKGC
ncbi:cytochrome P450 [Suillus subalutaceus]|uniref:cytochrome P450 n=1 Tax=Suillus subalutaceus TaxID=48586 RepID=UPI001B87D9C8|nr:cytochrome P450 [Suillus subalutaceus]KAG1839922.1 cytochrome P450 [Suillus subalutaceus]